MGAATPPPLLSDTSSVAEMLPRRVGDFLFALELLPRGPGPRAEPVCFVKQI